MLTKFFNTHSQDDEARTHLYREFVEYYVWKKQCKCWNKRKSIEVIGQVNGTNPSEEDKNYLRFLSSHVEISTSFQDFLTWDGVQYLLTQDGVQYLLFKEVAQRLGLLESIVSMSQCLHEGACFQMSLAMDCLFATISTYYVPGVVRKSWDTNSQLISEDFANHSQIYT